MGGGNGQKSKTARLRNLEKQKPAKGSQLDSNKKAMTIQVPLLVILIDLNLPAFPEPLSRNSFYSVDDEVESPHPTKKPRLFMTPKVEISLN